jgi:hypothetical protein
MRIGKDWCAVGSELANLLNAAAAFLAAALPGRLPILDLREWGYGGWW